MDAAQALGADIVLKVRRPSTDEQTQLKPGAVLIGMLDPFDTEALEQLATTGVTAFALESAPRITRAQSLDVLSSQANLAGYKAVLLGAHYYGRLFPMMMTAAGTLKAARVVVLGAGVAGLQAIATAKRLGAVVEASDVRPAAKEQVESLGAKFIDVPFETDEEREIAEGVRVLQSALAMQTDERAPGRYQIEAAIAALHDDAPSAARLDGTPGRAGVATLQAGRRRHHHRAHSRAPRPRAGQRRNRERHASGLGHCGFGDRTWRQLPAVGTGQGGRKAWCHAGGP